jgi:outer membrane protein assembly factor BamB
MNSAAPPQFDGRFAYLCTGDGGLRLLALRPGGRGDVTQTHIAWKSAKGVPSRTAPLLVDGRLFLVSEAGVLTCTDAATGRAVWQERLGGRFCSSPVYADGKFYAFDEAGRAVVGVPGAAWKKLADNRLDAGCMATPAIAGRALFVRTKTHLYRIEEKQ